MNYPSILIISIILFSDSTTSINCVEQFVLGTNPFQGLARNFGGQGRFSKKRAQLLMFKTCGILFPGILFQTVWIGLNTY